MKHNLAELYKDEKIIRVPDIIHFVWIGDINQACMDYINIWKDSNKNKKIFLWCDQDKSLVHDFHESIKKHVQKKNLDNIYDFERVIKNRAFDYIFPRIKRGESFDESIKLFLIENKIQCNYQPQENELNLKGNEIEIKCIDELFTKEKSDLYKYFCYEVILRGNLASASDIVRLLAIYMYGGVYIDIDTLPATDDAFNNLNKLLQEVNHKEDDFLMLFKSMKILNKISQGDCINNIYLNHYKDSLEQDFTLHQKILNAIDYDLLRFSCESILPLGDLFVHKNLLSIGAVKRFKGAYFNNFLFSHQQSKCISIILRNMKKRFRYLERNGYIFNFCIDNNEPHHYLSRISNWRSESLATQFSVTSIVTGPGLIVETMLGIAYELVNLEDLSTPQSVAEYMHDFKLGIASFKHNLDTPMGCQSSWRR